MDPMLGFHIRLVFTLPPRDKTLQYKNAYISEITFFALNLEVNCKGKSSILLKWIGVKVLYSLKGWE